MDARILRIGIGLAALASLGATHRTTNFIVHAPTPAIAKQVATAAEYYRKKLAQEWLGKEMPKWYRPCPVHVKVGQVGAGGATSFSFDRGEVFGWKMTVQGPLNRILDSVLPHEVCHTILACHFRQPLPRWADEGAATLAEDESEKNRQRKMVEQVLGTTRRIPLRKLLTIREYPRDMQNVLTLYAEGFSLADFLVQQGGKQRYLKFLKDAFSKGWDRALKNHYNHTDIDQLEKRWSSWVTAGSPSLQLPKGQLLADSKEATTTVDEPSVPAAIVRGQSPETKVTPRIQQVSAINVRPANNRNPVRRGRGLFAPNPRRTATRPVVRIELGASEEFPAESISKPLAKQKEQGRQQALNEGWLPGKSLKGNRLVPQTSKEGIDRYWTRGSTTKKQPSVRSRSTQPGHASLSSVSP